MTKFLASRVRGALAAFSFLALLANPSVGSATTLTTAQSFTTFNLTLSDAFGTGSFGSVTVSDLGGGVANFAVSVAPNYLVDTGAHSVLTFDPLFSAGGAVNSISNSHFTASGPGSYGNSPSVTLRSKSRATALTVQTPHAKPQMVKALVFTSPILLV
jgi:hypothetical protein